MAETPDTQRLISARRTESVDAPYIMCLVTSSTDALFGRTNVVNLMWVSYCYLYHVTALVHYVVVSSLFGVGLSCLLREEFASLFSNDVIKVILVSNIVEQFW